MVSSSVGRVGDTLNQPEALEVVDVADDMALVVVERVG
jgi:hypothetical protein